MGESADGVTEVHVILARLEGKLDANLAAHGGDINALKAQTLDHEARIRTGEKEINRLDRRPTVSPRQLWTGFTGAVAAGAALTAIFKFIVPA